MRRTVRIEWEEQGFTLVELLVVISIIALLLTILAPGLQRSRETAKKMTCQSNLKHQILACFLYMDDYDNTFPTVGTDPGWGSAVSYYSWGGKAGSEPGATTGIRLLNPYIGRVGEVSTRSEESLLKVFRCPADRGALAAAWPINRKPTCWDYLGWSYHYNSAALNNDGVKGLWRKRLQQVRKPVYCLLVGDFTMVTYFWSASPFQYMYWHNLKELGWTNAAFVDNHIEYIQMMLDEPNFQNGAGWTVLYNGPK